MRRPTLESRLSSLEAKAVPAGYMISEPWADVALWVLKQDDTGPCVNASTLFKPEDIERAKAEFNRIARLVDVWDLKGEASDRLYDKLVLECSSIARKMIAVGMT